MSAPTRTRAAVPDSTQAPSVTCPQCPERAEITNSFTLSSTDGPILHLRISCPARHHFTLPAERTDLRT